MSKFIFWLLKILIAKQYTKVQYIELEYFIPMEDSTQAAFFLCFQPFFSNFQVAVQQIFKIQNVIKI